MRDAPRLRAVEGRRRRSGRGALAGCGAVLLALSASACGASSSATAPSSGSTTPVGASTAPGSSTPGSTAPGSTARGGGPAPAGSSAPAGTVAAASMRGKRYCEVLLLQVAGGTANADVYNSYPLNDCPDALWSKLDPKAIAAAEGTSLAVLNGPRYWLMDRVEKEGGTEGLPKKDFGGIEMYRQASVGVGPLADAAKPYTTHEVNRSTVFTFDAGRAVYELVAADGSTYVMQTWSQQKDPTLAEADLAGLGARLQLPTGWTYRTRTLDKPLRVVTTTQAAKVLQDDLGNSYSQVAV